MRLLNKNEQFIDGSWYEQQYVDGGYALMYDKEHPEWAKEADRYAIDLITMFLCLNNDIRVLDLGSGVGNYMRSWRSRGFLNVSGIEISHTAVAKSGEPTLVNGSIVDMPFADGEFDLVFSASVLEHLDESILPIAIREMYRVGRMQGHCIGIEAGTDPSHINIKSLGAWAKSFKDFQPQNENMFVLPVEDILMGVNPFVLCVKGEDISYPLSVSIEKQVKVFEQDIKNG